MQKISGILPASSRITKVDLRDAPSVRPSAPDFMKDTGFGPALTWKARDVAKASVADEVSADFFTKYDGKIETGIERPELRPGVNFTPEEEIVPSFTPSNPMPMHQSLEPYAEQIYGPTPQPAPSTDSSGGSDPTKAQTTPATTVTGHNLDIYA